MAEVIKIKSNCKVAHTADGHFRRLPDGKLVCTICGEVATVTRRTTALPLSDTRIPFGMYKDQTFDETPLGYLDWLSGQFWIYGEFERRLSKYLKHPVVQRELELLFPDPDLESSDFTVMGTYTNREPMPKDRSEPRDWKPTKIGPGLAWKIFLDTTDRFNEVETIEDLQDAAKVVTPTLKRFLPANVLVDLRSTYKANLERLQLDQVIDSQLWADAQEVIDAIELLDQDESRDFTAEEAMEALQEKRPELLPVMQLLAVA